MYVHSDMYHVCAICHTTELTTGSTLSAANRVTSVWVAWTVCVRGCALTVFGEGVREGYLIRFKTLLYDR